MERRESTERPHKKNLRERRNRERKRQKGAEGKEEQRRLAASSDRAEQRIGRRLGRSTKRSREKEKDKRRGKQKRRTSGRWQILMKCNLLTHAFFLVFHDRKKWRRCAKRKHPKEGNSFNSAAATTQGSGHAEKAREG